MGLNSRNSCWKYPCVPNCTKGGSDTPRGLSVHQAKCPFRVEHDRKHALDLSRKRKDALESSRRDAALKARPNRLPRDTVNRCSPTTTPTLSLSGSDDTDMLDLSMPDTPPLTVPDVPDPVLLGRGQRARRPTWKILEQRKVVVDHQAETSSTPLPPEHPLPEFSHISSSVDSYGLYCNYLATIPATSHTRFTPTPIHFVEPATRVPPKLRSPVLTPAEGASSYHSDAITSVLDKCSSYSARLLMEWHWSSQTKSFEDTNRLVHEVIRDAHMHPDDLIDFDARTETKRLDLAIARLKDGWHESSIDIQVPDGQCHRSTNDPPVPTFTVSGLLHRSITEVIRSVWSDPETNNFQYVPFREYWTQGANEDERVLGELYTSEVFIEAHEELQKQPPEAGCDLERIICGLMLYSDSTHLASFGDASLWPLYMYFGNQSKYVRARPTSGSCHHIAYIPKVKALSTSLYRCA